MTFASVNVMLIVSVLTGPGFGPSLIVKVGPLLSMLNVLFWAAWLVFPAMSLVVMVIVAIPSLADGTSYEYVQIVPLPLIDVSVRFVPWVLIAICGVPLRASLKVAVMARVSEFLTSLSGLYDRETVGPELSILRSPTVV